LLTGMKGSGVLDRTGLVYGSMNEPPGARWHVPLTALTIVDVAPHAAGDNPPAGRRHDTLLLACRPSLHRLV
jgi:hypothetical protein